MKKSDDIEVFIPEEIYKVLEFKQEQLTGIAIVNDNLKSKNLKKVFSWNCSILIDFDKTIENRMPSEEELKIIEKFEEFLNNKIKGNNKEKPNALFFARITWNSTRQLIYKIYSPELANDFLTKLIDSENYPREFNYRIEKDETWELTEWYSRNIED